MKKAFQILLNLFLFGILTLLTQVGGLVFLISEFFGKRLSRPTRFKRLFSFLLLYLIVTLVVVPLTAPRFGREKVKHSEWIRPATYLTVLLNRNYVRPEMNSLLEEVGQQLKGTSVFINYLDANFPFLDQFPLLPHLSHDDGKKLDLSLVYETTDGTITRQQKSNSGYGVFAGPQAGEPDHIRTCLNQGYYQYDYSKYLTLGSKNNELVLSEKGTKALIAALLTENSLGKLFIEPHLKHRLKLKDNRVRFHGCRSVRHDDHIHIQLK